MEEELSLFQNITKIQHNMAPHTLRLSVTKKVICLGTMLPKKIPRQTTIEYHMNLVITILLYLISFRDQITDLPSLSFTPIAKPTTLGPAPKIRSFFSSVFLFTSPDSD